MNCNLKRKFIFRSYFENLKMNDENHSKNIKLKRDYQTLSLIILVYINSDVINLFILFLKNKF